MKRLVLLLLLSVALLEGSTIERKYIGSWETKNRSKGLSITLMQNSKCMGVLSKGYMKKSFSQIECTWNANNKTIIILGMMNHFILDKNILIVKDDSGKFSLYRQN